MQRFLLIVAILAVLLGGGGAAYLYFVGNPLEALLDEAPENAGDLLPFGDDTPPATTTPDDVVVDVTTPLPIPTDSESGAPAKLRKISDGPVATGAVAYQATSSAPGVAIAFIERASGNVFQYLMETDVVTRTSNRTVPGIQEAVWRPDGSRAYIRYLSGDTAETVHTYALPADGSGGFFLAQDLASIETNATSILTLSSGDNGSIGTTARVDGSQSKRVFTTPLSSIYTSFLGTSQYLVTTKASATLAGYTYLVNATGQFERLAGPLSGLSARPSPTGTWLLLSHIKDSVMHLSLLNLANREQITLPVATLADKCAWSKDATALYCGVPVAPPQGFAYPDDWYQGAVSFSDRIWRIDVAGRYAELVVDLVKEVGAPIDATALTLDPAESVLVFKNKRDASLWAYTLN